MALAARAAPGDRRAELAEVLGDDVDDAAAWADTLLSKPHPLVSAAAAAWQRDAPPTPELADWLARLPPAVETGPMPAQQDLDAWVTQRTRGLIDRFSITVGPTVVLLLASALATRVCWESP